MGVHEPPPPELVDAPEDPFEPLEPEVPLELVLPESSPVPPPESSPVPPPESSPLLPLDDGTPELVPLDDGLPELVPELEAPFELDEYPELAPWPALPDSGSLLLEPAAHAPTVAPTPPAIKRGTRIELAAIDFVKCTLYLSGCASPGDLLRDECHDGPHLATRLRYLAGSMCLSGGTCGISPNFSSRRVVSVSNDNAARAARVCVAGHGR
jgi:hypothetical protein